MTDDRSEPVPVVDEALEAAIDRFAEAVIYRSDCESPYVSGADSEVRESRQALLALSARVEEWRPIEEAPKDGTRIILAWGGVSVVGYYLNNSHARYMPWEGWRVPSMELLPRGNPTHFRPLPSPPIEKG